MKFFKKFSKEVKPERDREDDSFDFKIGGGWGDAINWSSREQFKDTRKQIKEVGTFSVVGWKFTRPKIGDVLYGEFVNNHMWFEFVEVRGVRDPADMFFGEVKLIRAKSKHTGEVYVFDSKGNEV